MTNKVEISRATPIEATAIQELTAESSKGMYRLCGWTDEDVARHFSPQKLSDGANKLMSAISSFDNSNIFLLAKIGDNLVGFCYAEILADRNRIEAVYIHPNYQGIGIGTKLYNEAFKSLNRDNDTFLEVFSLNSKAIVFYESLGFERTGRVFSENKYTDSKGRALEITEMMLKSK